jgi:hypothetical protein
MVVPISVKTDPSILEMVETRIPHPINYLTIRPLDPGPSLDYKLHICTQATHADESNLDNPTNQGDLEVVGRNLKTAIVLNPEARHLVLLSDTSSPLAVNIQESLPTLGSNVIIEDINQSEDHGFSSMSSAPLEKQRGASAPLEKQRGASAPLEKQRGAPYDAVHFAVDGASIQEYDAWMARIYQKEIYSSSASQPAFVLQVHFYVSPDYEDEISWAVSPSGVQKNNWYESLAQIINERQSRYMAWEKRSRPICYNNTMGMCVPSQ